MQHAKTPAQQRLMGRDLMLKRKGKKTVTGMSEKELEEFATKPKGGYPGKKKK